MENELQKAIKEKCLECSGYDQKEVNHCPIKRCALWPYRPVKEAKKKGGGTDAKG